MSKQKMLIILVSVFGVVIIGILIYFALLSPPRVDDNSNSVDGVVEEDIFEPQDPQLLL